MAEHDFPFNSEYRAKIASEAKFWDCIATQAVAVGIPAWVDYRRCTKWIDKLPEGLWEHHYDRELRYIERGELINRLICVACREKGRVLDLVCGAGWLSLELAREGMDVLGVDLSVEMIRLAQRFKVENPFTENMGKLQYAIKEP